MPKGDASRQPGPEFVRSDLEVPGFSGFEQLDDEGENVGRIWVTSDSPVRQMVQAGELLTPEQIALEESASPEEELAFQAELDRIRDADNRY